jgi:hypothetical protein
MLERLCPKLLTFFMQASLAEAFMWANFQVKFQKYSFAAKVGCYRRKITKNSISRQKQARNPNFFTIDTAQ